MPPVFPPQSRGNRASTLRWLDQTYDSQSFYNKYSTIFAQQTISPNSEFHESENGEHGHTFEGSLSGVKIYSANGGSLVDFRLLDNEVIDNSAELVEGVTLTTRTKHLATFVFASTIFLTVLLNIESVLNTILILLLFAPYPPPLRHSRFILLLPLLAHESVELKAKSEFVLIFSMLSALSLLQLNSDGNTSSGNNDNNTTTPLHHPGGSDLYAERDEDMQDMPGRIDGVYGQREIADAPLFSR
jgi:hypothetical protein